MSQRVLSASTSTVLGRGIHTHPDVAAAIFNEPSSPSMMTSRIPGPRAMEYLKGLNQMQDTRAAMLVQDIPASLGNYAVDIDGNTLLDLFAHIASISIGYNHPRMLALARSDDFIKFAANRPALGVVPPLGWAETLQKGLLKAAPTGLDQVFTAMCGSCSNEIAFKAAFMLHQHKKRGAGASSFTLQELQSCMNNAPPGSPDLAILSFKNGFHGRTLGTLTATRSKAIHKVDIPTMHNWPQADFPMLKYPLEENYTENAAEEERCLAQVEDILSSTNRIAAVIVEPIQGEGGDNRASASFFRRLRDITLENDVLMIVDEVQTGCGATGKMWAHDHWGLKTPPDMVTFAKKFQAAGMFHHIETRPSETYRNFNTWLGDPIRAMQARVIIEEIQDMNLLHLVSMVGSYLHQQLSELAIKYPTLISNVRGQGTYMAFDCVDVATRDKMLVDLRNRGVHMGGCGVKSIRLRPMLIFGGKHADIFLDNLEIVCKGQQE